VAGSFIAAFGGAPDGVWSAPGRVNLIGEHTDYNDGLCLPMALPQRTFAAVRRRPDRLVRIRSLQAADLVEIALGAISPRTPGGWGCYAAGALWALEQAGHVIGGLDILVDGRVPLGSGLSSSAALQCAVAFAASDLFGLGFTQDEIGRGRLAQLCVQGENTIAQAPTGWAWIRLLPCVDDMGTHYPWTAVMGARPRSCSIWPGTTLPCL
jgi:galactokinase